MSINIREIARLSGVSLTTVSRVINNSAPVKGETKAKVEQVIRDYNYHPENNIKNRGQHTINTIGVVIPNISNPFFCDLIKSISKAADKSNINIMVFDSDENPAKEEKILKKLKTQKIKGLIISPTTDTNEFNRDYLLLLENMGIPITLVDRDVKYSNFDGVFLDNVKGAYEATTALLNEGHEKIAVIAGPKSSKPGRDRLVGVTKAFAASGKDVDDSLVFYGDFKMQSGYEYAKEILENHKDATAIFCCNSLMALGCLKYLREKGVTVPKDIGFIYFDEIETLDILGLNYSCVAIPAKEMGELAMQSIVSQIIHKRVKNDISNRKILSPIIKLKGSEKL